MNSFEVSVVVDHDKAHAWEFYFNQINSWWSTDFHTSPRTKRFAVDTFIGGYAYEDYGEGGGLVWGTVIGVDYTNWLLIQGHLSRDFGGPVITLEKFMFDESQNQTKVTYFCDFIGNIPAKNVLSLKKGWEKIILVHYKNYCILKAEN